MDQSTDRARRSSPASPAEIHRNLGALAATLNESGLELTIPGQPAIWLDLDQTMALLDFCRAAGVRSLVNRAWLAAQHEALIRLAAAEERDQKRAA